MSQREFFGFFHRCVFDDGLGLVSRAAMCSRLSPQEYHAPWRSFGCKDGAVNRPALSTHAFEEVMSDQRSQDRLCINTIRTLSIDAIQKANSGHPGLPLGAAPMAYMLWQYHMRHDPQAPNWPDRDRFVLSAGHGSMLLYALLHLTGYDLSLDDIKNFRQWGSKTAGHPESFLLDAIECTTGPLGQGTANAVGMAMAERALAARYNTDEHQIVDHHTYALVGDGDLMEGLAAEACSLAGHLRLGKLIFLYDSNDISLDGPTSMAFTEDVAKRHAAYGWHVLTVEKGDDDLAALDKVIAAAKAETGKPSLIVVKTTIGFGSPNKAGKSDAHGAPLGDDELALTKQALNWESTTPFHVPDAARAHFATAAEKGARSHRAWQETFAAWSAANPTLADEWRMAHAGELPNGWDAEMPQFKAGDKLATRVASGQIINAIAKTVPWFLGGDADLSCSTKTAIKDEAAFDGQSGQGRNIHYGVREHAMAGAANGMAYHGGLMNYTATFFCFADYMRPAMRLAALSSLPVVFVFTHDSVAVGEDGPTHQPVEHLASLRAMPNMLVLRPADATEAVEAWRVAVQQTKRPVSLVFSRQGLPVIDRDNYADAAGVQRGGYVLADPDQGKPSVILIATGSEVTLALEAQGALSEQGIPVRVVSMPSWELFAEQDQAYRDQVLPPTIDQRIAVEAGTSFGWERWIGANGTTLTIDRFGASAPGGEVLARYGFTADHLVAKVKDMLGR